MNPETPEIERLVDEICSGLGLTPKDEVLLRQELASHLEDAACEYLSEGLSEKEALRKALEGFGKGAEVRDGFKRTYMEVYLMASIGRIIYSKPAAATGIGLALLAALATFLWGFSGFIALTKLPPSPTAWHDADSSPLFFLAASVPMLLLFSGSIVQWIRTKVMPSKLVIWTAGLFAFLFLLADLAVK